MADYTGALDLAPIQKLINQIISRRDSAYVKTRKIEKYLRQNYKYTLDLKSAVETNPLEDFLFASKEGHCEYFASAMALMLRMEGIPARVATGFLMDEKNSEGEYYIVRAQDAHAWVEAYLGGFWLEFDPTPRISRFERTEVTLWQKARQKVDYLNFLWNYHVLGYDMEYQEKVARKVEFKSGELSMGMDRVLGKWRRGLFPEGKSWRTKRGGREEPSPEESSNGLRKWILALILGAAGFLAWKKLKHHFKFGGKRSRAGAEFYQEFLTILEGKGLPRQEGETPREFRERLEQIYKTAEIKNELKFLTNLFYQIRFGAGELSSQEAARVKAFLKEIRAQILSPSKP